MRINQAGIDLIKSFEGVRLAAYRCPAGVLTIGVGHTGPDVHLKLVITLQEAEALLRGDLDHFEAAVAKAAPSATPNQAAAMISLAFNIGIGAFLKSSVLRHHNAGNPGAAANAFLLWVKGGGRKLPGLVRRRAAERKLYLTP